MSAVVAVGEVMVAEVVSVGEVVVVVVPEAALEIARLSWKSVS